MTKARELSDYTGLQGDLALKSPVASPVFTGNVGIGVTPETWGTNGDFRGLQVGSGLSLYGRGAGDEDRVGMMGNAYHDATNDRYEYIGTGHATHYAHSDGQHIFQVAPSGTADAAISWNTAMAIDNAGIVTKPLQPAFQVRGGSNVALPLQTYTIVDFNIETFDQNLDFNTTTKTFTAPVTGKYQFNVQILWGNWDSGANYYYLQLQTSNRIYYELFSGESRPGDPAYCYGHIHVLADMDAGDVANVKMYQNQGNSQTTYDDQTIFTGHLVC